MSVGPTTLRLGYTNPLTGVFGAHPTLGAVLDLNDAATFTALSPDGLELAPPERSVVPAGNIRTQGERAVRALYRHNRQARIGLIIGPMADSASLVSTVRTLLRWLSAPPQMPFCVQWQPPSASAPVYLDVVACGHDLPTDESQWLRLQLEPVAIELWVRPGLRGDLVRLSNLVSNPGFEAPMGGVGTAASAPVAFSDPFTTLGQYSQIGGGAPTLLPADTYVDTVMANGGANLLRYYRLGEVSGTSAYDIGGTGQTGTYNGSPTLGVAGAISGDTDTAITLNGSTQFVSLPTTGLPTGTAAWSVGCWVKLSATPSAFACMATWGTNIANQRAEMGFNSGGQPYVGFGGGAVATGVVLTNSVWHLVVGTFDGVQTLTLYVDGAQVAQNTSATGGSIVSGVAYIGQFAGATGKLAGSLDEVKLWRGALSAGQISAIYTAGHSGASGTLANAMSVPNGATLGFGSPAWGAIQTWQVRFRWVTGLTAGFYAHYTNGSNFLEAWLNGSGLNFVQAVGGAAHAVASPALFTLTHEAYYWLVVTQFPAPPGDPPYVQATLCYDDAGAVGSQVAQIAGSTFDAVTALSGTGAIAASGAALVLGGQGNSGGAGNQVSLFGPGGWTGIPTSGTVPAAMAWDGSVAGAPTSTNTPGTNTAPLGATNSGNLGLVQVPVTSFGSARIDAPPAGAFTGVWQSAPPNPSLTQLQQSGIAVKTGGDVLKFTGMLRATGNGTGYRAYIQVNEYTSAAGFVTGTQQTLALGSGSFSTWAAWNMSLTTQATTAYVAISLIASDGGSTSAGSSTWYDNVQCWDNTVVAQNGMPYCELRFPNSPTQLLLSGLLGDLPAPAALSFGAYVASWPLGSLLAFALGRGAGASSTARLVGSSYGYFGAGASPVATAALDGAGYGGFYAAALMNPGWNPRPFSVAPSDAPGVYHLLERFWSGQTTANIANVQARANVLQRGQAWYGQLNGSDQLWDGYGPWASLLAAGSTWAVCDAGQVQLPPQVLGALTDPGQNFLTPYAQWVDNTGGGGSQGQASWAALLPVDGSLLVGVLNNPSNAPFAVAQQWVWAYFDGLLTNRAGAQDGPAWGYSIEAGGLPNPAHAGGGPGTQTTGSINVNSGADPYLLLDPQVTVPQTGQQGVNQLVGYLADGNAAVLPFAAEIAYTPLYLWPR